MKDNIEELVKDMKCEFKFRILNQDYLKFVKYCEKCDGYDYECLSYKPSLDKYKEDNINNGN